MSSRSGTTFYIKCTRTDYPFSAISPTVQVLDWLEKHGEVFLRKNVGIGRNLAKSRAYQKSHETFEGVVQVGNFTLSPLGSLKYAKLSFEQKHISIDTFVFVFVFVYVFVVFVLAIVFGISVTSYHMPIAPALLT